MPPRDPPIPDLRRLRQLHRGQWSPLDLGALAHEAADQPAQHGRRRLWPCLAAAAGVALVAGMLWQRAEPGEETPLARSPAVELDIQRPVPGQPTLPVSPVEPIAPTEPTDDPPPLFREPHQAASSPAQPPERRPILPGMASMSRPRLPAAAPPSAALPPTPRAQWQRISTSIQEEHYEPW